MLRKPIFAEFVVVVQTEFDSRSQRFPEAPESDRFELLESPRVHDAV